MSHWILYFLEVSAMDLFEAIISRRSIRKFTKENVSNEDINILLRAAMQAPSACNEQPWSFVVVRDGTIRQSLATELPYSKMASQAPVVIVVCGDLSQDRANGFWVQDCSAAIENLLLAAYGRELGAVWCGIHPLKEREEIVRAILNLPEHVIPFALVPLGHPAQVLDEVNRFKPDRIHNDRW